MAYRTSKIPKSSPILKLYRAKRDFTKTVEPSGAKSAKTKHGQSLSYLIQKHDARRLHYDFRLELDGTLKSWAVTRGPSLNPSDKRLAVHVEDHPLDYGSFEGTIPQGQYGGGTVMLWDKGSWEPLEDLHKGYNKGHLRFCLHGERLKGEWHLVRMKGRTTSDSKRDNWLLMKAKDRYSNTHNGESTLEKWNTSVKSAHKMDAIAASAQPAEVMMKRQVAIAPKTKPKRQKRAQQPEFVEVELATLVNAPPIGNEWIHEIKFDGYRALTHIQDGKIKIMTRNQKDWTAKFQSVADALEKCALPDAILDGEIVAVDQQGKMSFSGLQRTLSDEADFPLHYYVFDLLFLNGEDLRDLPLLERKNKLRSILPKHAHIHFSEHFEGPGKDILDHSCQIGLEGIISKRKDAAYRSGRHDDWVKSKCLGEQEMVIGGFTYQPKHPDKLAALLIGYYEDKKLRYAGKVGTGFNEKERKRLIGLFKKKISKSSDFTDIPKLDSRSAQWVKPIYVAQIGFTEWTEDGRLRHPVYKGLREDKPAKQINRETPKRLSLVSPMQSRSANASTLVTHADKILYPKDRLTKGDLASYYESIADLMLPYISHRPLSLVRCPDGIGKQCFYQRHAGEHASKALHSVKINMDGKHQPYFWIKDRDGLMALVQMGALEIHCWPVKVERLAKPDMLIFDFDPGEEVSFSAVRKAVAEMRERLRKLKLESFLKMTGGHGLHVIVPLGQETTWEQLRSFAEELANRMAKDHPNLYTINSRKVERVNRIYIDYLRNNKGASAIAPYSSRARDGAAVALPLPWSALDKLKSANGYSIKDAARILSSLKDPWLEFATLKQKLPKTGFV